MEKENEIGMTMTPTEREKKWALRAQDKSAPKIIALWIAENIETAPDSKLRYALEEALQMRRWLKLGRAVLVESKKGGK